ncbi:MAG: metalloprotease ybeY [Gemmatimonadetes bacterium]|nr:metalloprotease ybeY [Gemmatimonadota bacterium]
MDVSADGTRAPLGRNAIAEIARGALRAERVRNALLSIALLDRRGIARINKTHLGHAGPTDVISFGFTRATPADPVVGDIYICPDVARDNAKARGTGVRDELARLVIHGVLHVLGYEHPVDDGRETSAMWKRQERLLARLTGRSAR